MSDATEPSRALSAELRCSLLSLSIFLLPFLPVGAAIYGLSLLEERLAEHPLAPLVSVMQPFVAVAGALLAWPLVDRAGFLAMRASFSLPTPWWGVLAGLLMPAGYAMVGPSHSRLMRADLRFTEEQIGWLSGVVDPISGVIGALTGGLLADRLGLRPAIGALMTLIALTLAGFALSEPYWADFRFMVVWVGLNAAAVNAYSASTLGLYMGISNPRVAATQFAVYMATTNLTYAWTSPFGGAVADGYGYVALFTVATVFQIVTIALLVPLDTAKAAAFYRSRG